MDNDNNKNTSSTENSPEENSRPGFKQVFMSTLAAALGVQSNKNRERDFKHGNIWVYALAGLIFTVLFIVAVVTVVRIVLSNAGM